METNISARIPSKTLKIGTLIIGDNHPILVQSMTNTPTKDIEATYQQCKRIIDAGADMVRVSTPTLEDAISIKDLKEKLKINGYQTPIIADIHFSAKIAETAAMYADKIRINPGNYAFSNKPTIQKEEEMDSIRKNLKPLIEICNTNGVAIRIGVNHGSLSKRILADYGNTPKGMVVSAMEYIEILESLNFYNLVVSLKSSNTKAMIQSNRLFVETMLTKGQLYPIHLGVTEAGADEDGRIKSSIGIGTLLAEGIGNTIRVSLTEAPENEVPVALQIIKKAQTHNERLKSSPISLVEHKLHDFPKHTVVIGDSTHKKTKNKETDFIFYSDADNLETLGYFIDKKGNKYKYFRNLHACFIDKKSETEIDFVKVRLDLLKEIQEHAKTLSKSKDIVFVFETDSPNYVLDCALFIQQASALSLSIPIIVKQKISAFPEIDNAIDMGILLLDYKISGLWLYDESIKKDCEELAFGILQACDVRRTKTDFISCPTCSRTLFDIQSTLKEVKQKTGHLKGLKIGVMGCIVNGPGEMADADYGYVGAGKGKVTLYKGQIPMKKNIDEQEAVKELVQLIKESGDWIEP